MTAPTARRPRRLRPWRGQVARVGRLPVPAVCWRCGESIPADRLAITLTAGTVMHWRCPEARS